MKLHALTATAVAVLAAGTLSYSGDVIAQNRALTHGALGAGIGAIAGGGKGAAIGGIVGLGVGAARDQQETQRRQQQVEQEQRVYEAERRAYEAGRRDAQKSQ